MPHPHQQIVFSRKQVGATKKLAWGDPSRLEKIHRQLRKQYVVNVTPPRFSRNFLQLDRDYPSTLSLRGFQALLVNSGVQLSQEDSETLFAFYDAEGHGSLDPNDFLIGLRYNLAMEKEEMMTIIDKLGKSLLRMRSQADVEALLRDNGMPSTGVTENMFVQTLKGFSGSLCTTSELLFLFSLISKNDRSASVTLTEAAGLLFEPQRLRSRPPTAPELLRRLALIIYDPKSSVGGRIGLNKILSRGDKDFNGAVNRREFDTIKSFSPFTDQELDIMFAYLDPSGRGTIQFDDLVRSYRPQDYLRLDPEELHAIEEITVRHIRHRSPGGPGMRRTYDRYLQQTLERHDPQQTGFFTLTQFYRALEDLAGGDLKDLEIELLFEHWARDGRVDWRDFLRVLLGEPAREAEKARRRAEKWQDGQYAQELRERMALALYDENRQAKGPLGLVRIERIFDRYELKGDKQLTRLEFQRAMKGLPAKIPFDEDDIDIVFHSFDTDRSDTISVPEFTAAMQAIVDEKWPKKKPEAPYPYEPLSRLHATLAQGAVRRRLGAQGLVNAFGKYDRDGDGFIDQRAFGAVLRYVCHPCPTEENIGHLFRHHASQGRLPYAAFVAGLNIEQYYAPTEAEYAEVFARLSAVSLLTGQSTHGTPDGLRRVFDRHARTTPGHLNLSEFLKALRSLGYAGPALDVEYAYLFFRPTEGITYDQFVSAVRGTALNPAMPSTEGLLQLLHRGAFGDDKAGTITLARLLTRNDVCKAGVVDLKGFKAALRAVGAPLTETEVARLFQGFQPGKRHGAIDIREFLERLRLSVNEPTDLAKLERLINTLSSSVEFRNQGMRGWESVFQAHDPQHTGRVDFAAYTRAMEAVHNNKLSDYEVERLFNHFSRDGQTLVYAEFIGSVMRRPLDRTHSPKPDPYSKDATKYVLEPRLLDEAVPRPPSSMLADPTLLPRFLRLLYDPRGDGIGSLRLASFCRAAGKGQRYLKKRDFITAINGLARPDGELPEFEVVALYEQLKEGELGVDLEALQETARYSHDVTLPALVRSEMLSGLQEQMWYSGRRDLPAVMRVFKTIRADGRLDLHTFTISLHRSAGGLYSDLELELLFNSFSPDRQTVVTETFARAITPQGRPAPPPPPPPSVAAAQRTIEKLAAHIYDPRRPTGTLEFLKGIRRADRNRDDKLNRQEFLESAQYVGGLLVCTHAELNELFDTMCEGEGIFAQVDVGAVLRRLRAARAEPRPSLAEYQSLLTTVKRFLPYAPHDLAAIRMFERQDPAGAQSLSLGPFTTAMYELMNKDAPLTELQIERIFDFLDPHQTGRVNYMDFLAAIAGLPTPPKPSAAPAPRVLDVYRRTDVQPDMVRSPVALRPPPAVSLPPAESPFRASSRVLPLGQPGMANWHKTSELPDRPAAGGAPTLPAREAQHRRYKGLWVPATKSLTDWGESGSPCSNVNPEAPRFEMYIPRCADDAASEVSVGSALPPYLKEASSMEEWLALLGLQKYLPLMRANEVDLVSVSELTEANLEEMGFPLGPRKKILKAARAML